METPLEALAAVGLILAALANVAATAALPTRSADASHHLHVRSAPAGALQHAPLAGAPAGISFERFEFSKRNGPSR